ncbi:MAG: oligosaccharide flippase family protein [Chloroflexi bacterium]|nr:oligosaccharide flippase family protein [Chloroflexota bacterium]
MNRRLSRHTLILIVNNLGSAALSFAIAVLIGRTLGGAGLGVYAAVLAWLFPLGLLAEFGLGTLMTREVAQNPAQGGLYLRALLRFYLLSGTFCVLTLWLVAPLLVSDAAVAAGLRLSAGLLWVAPCFGAFTALFRAQGQMWPIPLLNIGMWLAQCALTAAALLLGAGLTAVLAINALTSAGQLLAAWGIYRRHFFAPDARATLRLGYLLRRALPFALGAVLVALQARASTILLERLSDTAQTGYYTAANRLIEAGRMLPNAFFGALFPALAALAAQPAAMRQTFRRALGGLALFGALAGAGLTVFAPLLPLLYGGDFAPAIPVLQTLAWALLPALLRAGLTLYAYARGREAAANAATLILLLLHIALAAALIPVGGALGAAWVTLGVETIGTALLALVGLPSPRPPAQTPY